MDMNFFDSVNVPVRSLKIIYYDILSNYNTYDAMLYKIES